MTPSAQLATFAGIVWPQGACVEIRPLPVVKGESLPGWVQRRWVRADILPTLYEELKTWNDEGQAQLYAGVLPRKGDGLSGNDNCESGQVMWMDADGWTPDEAKQRVADAGLPAPSLLVATGHGVHAYWRLTGLCFPDRLSKLVGDLARMLGSDVIVANTERIMRLPGFRNHKPPPADCYIVEADASRVYDFLYLRQVVPSVKAVESAPLPVAVNSDRRTIIERASAYIDRIEGSTEGKRNISAYRVCCILRREFALSDAEAKPILSWWNGRNSPPLPDAELDELLKSGDRYALKPYGAKLEPQRQQTGGKGIPLPDDADSSLPAMFAAEARGERTTLELPWPLLSSASRLGRPGTVCVIAGPPGFGKGWLRMGIEVHFRREGGASVAHLPLEDSRSEMERRVLALMSHDWSVLDVSPEGAAARQAAYDKYQANLPDITCGIAENPLLPVMEDDGKLRVPQLPPEDVLDWMERAASTHRVVSVDPLSLIDWEYNGKRENKAQADFMRRTVGLAAGTGATIILVAHTIKRPGRAGQLGLTQEDVQGTKLFTNIAHCVLLLEAHEPRESTVIGQLPPVWHSRTLTIGKARFGNGLGFQFAFDFNGPELVEKGVITPRKRGRRASN